MSASTTRKNETAAGGRRRRAFGTVERLPSGNFRARVLGPDAKYVSAPMTFATKADATVGGCAARGPGPGRVASPSPSPTGGCADGGGVRAGVDHPASFGPSGDEGALCGPAAEVHRGSSRRSPGHGPDCRGRARVALRAGGAIRSGRRAAPVAAMSTAVTDGVIDAQPCRICGGGTPKAALGRVPDMADRCSPRCRSPRSPMPCRPATGPWCSPRRSPGCAKVS